MTVGGPIEVVAALVLVGLAVPAVRVLADGAFRRLFGHLASAIAATVVAWIALVVIVAVAAPALLVLAAVLGGAVALVLAWRARDGYGRSRGLPPGSLALTTSVRGLAHRDAYQRAATTHGPIFKSAQFHRPVVCVVGIERGQRLVREHDSAMGPSPLPFTQQLMGDFLRYMDDDTHDVYGPLLRRAVSPACIAAAAPIATEATRRELDLLPTADGDGDGLPGEAASIDPHLEAIAFESVVRALLGLQRGTPRFDAVRRLMADLARRGIMHPLDRRSRLTLGTLRSLVAEQVADLDAGTVDPSSVPSALGELRSTDGGQPDVVSVDNLLMMQRIGTANVVGLLRWLVVLVGSDPALLPRLRDDLDRESDAASSDAPSPDLFDALVLETLRLAQSEYVYRRLTAEVEFDGFRLPKGWLVRLCVAESHRDPTVFPDPDRMTDRFLGRRPPQTELCPFGFGRHACNAAGLATTIARRVLIELAASPGLVVLHDGHLTREPRHWSHWRPAPPVRAVLLTTKPQIA